VVIRNCCALLVLTFLGGACTVRRGARAQPEGPSVCRAAAVQTPQSAPAFGGYDAGPGPKIGETQPLLIAYPTDCYPAWWLGGAERR
jgi:hypothetical protein